MKGTAGRLLHQLILCSPGYIAVGVTDHPAREPRRFEFDPDLVIVSAGFDAVS